MTSEITEPMDSTNLEAAMSAKAQRDAVRHAVLGVIRGMENPPAELRALLAADDAATEAFRKAMSNQQQEEKH